MMELAYFPEPIVPYSLFAASQIHEEIRKHRLLPGGCGLAFGEDIRIDFTLIGRTVNMASRLCNLAGKDQVGMSASYFNLLPAEIQKQIGKRDSCKSETIRIKANDPEIDTVVF